jgi:pyruvate kinase
VYIDDGNLSLQVTEAHKSTLKCVVLEGGILKERKGINMPGARLEFDSLTDKDRADIQFGIEHEVDYVALSFVRHAKDVREAAALIKPSLPKCRIVAKVESRQAIRNIDASRSPTAHDRGGDMGSPSRSRSPHVQQIIRKCNAACKPVITATQMLEHMTEHSRPTRAEVTDVANAILDGTDFVMLSAETAVGRFPCESVRMMNDIIKFTEKARPLLEAPAEMPDCGV